MQHFKHDRIVLLLQVNSLFVLIWNVHKKSSSNFVCVPHLLNESTSPRVGNRFELRWWKTKPRGASEANETLWEDLSYGFLSKALSLTSLIPKPQHPLCGCVLLCRWTLRASLSAVCKIYCICAFLCVRMAGHVCPRASGRNIPNLIIPSESPDKWIWLPFVFHGLWIVMYIMMQF